MGKTDSPVVYLRYFLDQWATLDPAIFLVFNNVIHKGKLCLVDMHPWRSKEARALIIKVYSKRSNDTCLKLSVTLARSISFWELFKDSSWVP